MATKGTVSGVIANMVTLGVDGPVAQNEICYISTGGDKLMAEVIKVVGSKAAFMASSSGAAAKMPRASPNIPSRCTAPFTPMPGVICKAISSMVITAKCRLLSCKGKYFWEIAQSWVEVLQILEMFVYLHSRCA